ncbi:MAG: hypothetical protein K8W52_41285 [Deltaproteobacteria bacterium]|nr:hypothetical protein [Deltaproteobacteria bacterium]
MSSTRSSSFWFAALVVIAAVVGAAWSRVSAAPESGTAGRAIFADDGPPSPVIFPTQRIPITFSHAAHLNRAPSLQCVDCHDHADDSRASVDRLVPDESACEMCHPIDRAKPDLVLPGKPPVACVACHPGWKPGQPVARVEIEPPNLKFDHAAHKTTACTFCHGDLAKSGTGLATREDLPRMRLCLTCHDDQARGTAKAAPSACTTCHLADAEGRVRIQLPDGLLMPTGVLVGDAHEGDFRTRHANIARTDAGYCATCHAERFCSDCHLGVEKPRDFHAGNYVLTHATEARRGTPDCSACHRAQSFCVACHERSGVGTRAGSEFDSAVDGRRFHPDGWADNGRGGNSHAREFQRNPNQCASCHREDFCLECHSNQESASDHRNPHGRGWRGSARCEALARRNGRMCLRCHVTAAETGCDWAAQRPVPSL